MDFLIGVTLTWELKVTDVHQGKICCELLRISGAQFQRADHCMVIDEAHQISTTDAKKSEC